MSDLNKPSRDSLRFYVPPLDDVDSPDPLRRPSEGNSVERVYLGASLQVSNQKKTARYFAPFGVGVIVIAIVLVVSLCIATYRLLWIVEPKSNAQCVDAKIIDYRGTQTTGSARFHTTVLAYFLLELPNGREVMAEPNGTITPAYRGTIALSVRQGLWTGHKQYGLTSDKTCLK